MPHHCFVLTSHQMGPGLNGPGRLLLAFTWVEDIPFWSCCLTFKEVPASSVSIINISVKVLLFKRKKMGVWVAGSVKRPTLDLGSSLDLPVYKAFTFSIVVDVFSSLHNLLIQATRG